VSDPEKLAELMNTQLQDNDMVITQGAGTIGVIARKIIQSPLLTVNANVKVNGAKK
jgi:UDP-N-acetylmuramate--alanine ligase